MKKGWFFGIGIMAVLFIAGAAIGVSTNARVDAIQAQCRNPGVCTAKEMELLDMDHNGTINSTDLLLAKVDALVHHGKPTQTVYAPIAENVKLMGRTFYSEDTKTLWCGLSGSGISFTVHGNSCSLTLVGDSTIDSGETSAARYAVYLNGNLFSEAQMTVAESTITLFDTDTPQDAVVRVVKLSEAAHSCIGIRDICVKGDTPIAPTPAKEHLIEFIGDSITCGYGVDKEETDGGFQTLTENVTRTYAYRTAEALDCDYSMVSYSGYGIISGYTTNGKANPSQVVPKWYGKVGFSYATFESDKRLQDQVWEFSSEPDLIVINLGTNDASYTGTDAAKQQEYVEGYVAFLKRIRERNPNAPILCTLGIMGDTLCESMEHAATAYTTETGDSNIRTMRFAVQNAADGYAVDWHPTAATHDKAAQLLTTFIREWLHW